MRGESSDVYKVLVADLSQSIVPTSIMTVTLVGISCYSYHLTGLPSLLLAGVMGGSASIAKILLIAAHLRRNARGNASLEETKRWEKLHAAATLGVASSVSCTAVTLFFQSDMQLQLLATGLIFGYCSGIVTRMAIRPMIAIQSLLIAAFPSILVTAFWGRVSEHIIAIIFGMFLLGALETVRYAYKTAASNIATRLDMATLARNDPMTGLANRLGLRKAFREATATPGDMVVYCLDLDGFKNVNDCFGHAVGDATLVAVAERLAELGRDFAYASIARVGGDEFVILQSRLRHQYEAALLAQKIVRTLSEPIQIGKHRVEIGVSVGYAIAPSDTCNLDDMLSRADEVSYRIKRSGGGLANLESYQPLDMAAA